MVQVDNTQLQAGFLVVHIGLDQVPKLENAVNQTNGNYVFVIVSNDAPAAQSFLNAQIDAALKTA